jgi:hypothetical protein
MNAQMTSTSLKHVVLFMVGIAFMIGPFGMAEEAVKKELGAYPILVTLRGATGEVERTAYTRGNRTVLVLETEKLTMEGEKPVTISRSLIFSISKTEFVRVELPKPGEAPFVREVIGGAGLIVRTANNYVRVFNKARDYCEQVDIDGSEFKLASDKIRLVVMKAYTDMPVPDLKDVYGLQLPD